MKTWWEKWPATWLIRFSALKKRRVIFWHALEIKYILRDSRKANFAPLHSYFKQNLVVSFWLSFSYFKGLSFILMLFFVIHLFTCAYTV
jgi:hypothetical protein